MYVCKSRCCRARSRISSSVVHACTHVCLPVRLQKICLYLPLSRRHSEGVAEHSGMATDDAQNLLHRRALQLWKRGHVALLAPFGVHPSSRLKQNIHSLTDDDLDLLKNEYCTYAKRDILSGEKSVMHVKFASDRAGGIHSFSRAPPARTSAATTSGADRSNIGAKEHVDLRVANDGIAHSKAELIKQYGIITGEKPWNETVEQGELWEIQTFDRTKEMARIAREKKACEDVKTGGATEHVGEEGLRGSHSKPQRPPRWPELHQ